MNAVAWQRHAVRGFVLGAMKKAGHEVESLKRCLSGGARQAQIEDRIREATLRGRFESNLPHVRPEGLQPEKKRPRKVYKLQAVNELGNGRRSGPRYQRAGFDPASPRFTLPRCPRFTLPRCPRFPGCAASAVALDAVNLVGGRIFQNDRLLLGRPGCVSRQAGRGEFGQLANLFHLPGRNIDPHQPGL